MGLTRTEQWTLIAAVILIGIGFCLQHYRQRDAGAVVWVEAGENWAGFQAGSSETSMLPGSVAGSALRRDPSTSVEDGAEPANTPALIDLNRAPSAELELLPGIGPSKARAIEAFRSDSGGFTSIDQLIEVKGIGPKTLEGLRRWVTVSPIRRSEGSSTSPIESFRTDKVLNTGDKRLGWEPLDLNRASTDQLQTLNGVGPVLAERIVQERSRQPFRTVEELLRVRGIGPKRLEQIRNEVTIR